MIPQSEWQHRFVETNQIRLHCVVHGEGELVVLLHGFPEFWYSWRHQIPVLGRHFKVVVPDLRGYNDSDKPETGYDLANLAADIRGLIQSFGYTKAHIVGHDWGGVIAWHLAQKFPELLGRLAILNAPHPQRFIQELFTNVDQVRRSWYILAFQLPGLPEWMIQHNLKEFVRTVFSGQAIRKGAFSSEDTALYQAALEKPGVLSAAINYYRQLFHWQQWVPEWQHWTKTATSHLPFGNPFERDRPLAPGNSTALLSPETSSSIFSSPDPVTVPTLILWGEEDPFLSKNLTEGMERLVTAPLQIKLIPHCGHWIQQEVPQTVNRELLNFLRVPYSSR